MTGARAGPANVQIENAAIAFALSNGVQISANTPGALDSGALTKVPVRNLPTNRAPKFGAQVHRKLKAM